MQFRQQVLVPMIIMVLIAATSQADAASIAAGSQACSATESALGFTE